MSITNIIELSTSVLESISTFGILLVTWLIYRKGSKIEDRSPNKQNYKLEIQMSENIDWILEPEGNKNEAHRAILNMFRYLFGARLDPNKTIDSRWEESGLVAKEDPETGKWGVVCSKPEIASKIRERKLGTLSASS